MNLLLHPLSVEALGSTEGGLSLTAPKRAEVIVVWTRTCPEVVDSAVMASGLPPHELQRASEFRHPNARAEFITGRALLRRTLATFTGTTPRTLPIALNPRGKPYLATPGTPWEFSLSHSHSIVGLAVACGVRVGLDLEPREREPNDWRALARWALSDLERERLDPLTEADARAAFLRFWVCKEALLKGLGTGLQSDPRTCRIAGLETETDPPRLQALPDPESASDWSLHLLSLGSTHLAAVAWEGGPSPKAP